LPQAPKSSLAAPQAGFDPSRWKADDLRNDESWICQLTSPELQELHRAAELLHDRRLEPKEITKSQCQSSVFDSVIERARLELTFGRGIALLRGLNVDDYAPNLLKTLYFGLGVHLGNIAKQNSAGDLINSVTDVSGLGGQTDNYQASGHRGRAEMLPHTDSADIVGLLCVRPAKQGGSTTVCSSGAIYEEMADRHPQYLNALCDGFFFDMAGKTARGFSERRLPIFSRLHGRLSCHFNKSRIHVGMKKAGMSLDEREIAALDCMTELALSPDFALRFDLRAGDILWLNSHCTLHARHEYEDWPEPDRKRLLLRLWAHLPTDWHQHQQIGIDQELIDNRAVV
jgi:hypothetical protein